METNAMKIKWTQNRMGYGLERCGFAEYSQIRQWLNEFSEYAKANIQLQDKPHAVYGRIVYDEDGSISEVFLYREAFVTDAELDCIIKIDKGDTIYAIHKQ